jgi:hypothetical protein
MAEKSDRSFIVVISKSEGVEPLPSERDFLDQRYRLAKPA